MMWLCQYVKRVVCCVVLCNCVQQSWCPRSAEEGQCDSAGLSDAISAIITNHGTWQMYTLIASINSAHCHNNHYYQPGHGQENIWKLQLHTAADQTVVAVCFRNIFSLSACWLVVRESVSPHLPWCVKIVTNVSWVWFVRLFGQILSWHVTWQRIMTDITAAIYILWGARERDQHQMTLHSTPATHSRAAATDTNPPHSSSFQQVSSVSIVSI